MAITISGNGITTNEILDGTITTDDISASDVTSLKSGRKNIIINGDMQVSQRGDYTTATSISQGAYSLDRWKTWQSNTSPTVQQTTLTTGGITYDAYKLLATTTTASGYMEVAQLIEDKNFKYILGQEVTLSAYVQSNHPVKLSIWTNQSGSYIQSSAHPADGSVVKLTVTYTVPSNSTAFRAYISTYDNAVGTVTSGDYFTVSLVQLELGDTATDFEHRSYGEELALCQRYYHRITQDGSSARAYVGTGRGENSALVNAMIPLPVTMRTVPTHSVSSLSDIFFNGTGNLDGVSSWSNDGSTTTFAHISAGASATGGYAYAAGIDHSTSGWISFDAEL